MAGRDAIVDTITLENVGLKLFMKPKHKYIKRSHVINEQGVTTCILHSFQLAEVALKLSRCSNPVRTSSLFDKRVLDFWAFPNKLLPYFEKRKIIAKL